MPKVYLRVYLAWYASLVGMRSVPSLVCLPGGYVGYTPPCICLPYPTLGTPRTYTVCPSSALATGVVAAGVRGESPGLKPGNS